MKRLRIALGALCLAGAAYFLLPAAFGVFHLGMVYPAALLMLFALPLFFPRLLRHKAARIALGALSAAVVCVLAVCLWIGLAANDRPEDGQEVTVLVLGCQVVGEKPSLMLRGRIDAAYDYLAAHPEAVCVATGGMGDTENISEGECIRRELVARGIDGSCIYVEDQSVNTAQNMLFSAAVIEENGLPTTVAVVSDNFHQLRAALFARRAGLEPLSLGCSSHPLLAGGYWAREVAALAAAYLRGY